MRWLFSLLVAVSIVLSSVPSAAMDDSTLFTQMVLMEAAHEPLMGRVAVAAVALDRMQDRRWPRTLRGVLQQRRQFTGLWIPQVRFDAAHTTGAQIAILLAERGVRPCGTGVYWYHADYIAAPLWTRNLEVACHIGHHIFYRDKL